MKKLSLITLALGLAFALNVTTARAADDAKPGKDAKAKHQQDLLKKYDKNHDGKLDAEEKAAMKEDTKKKQKKHSGKVPGAPETPAPPAPPAK